ncbi:MAG TPA: murein L,D-transpeptidase catalytic domain family protein, partial [Thermoanaerobaculia bacterium]|nr:murein L,D-transpeptidase catalytic domain family protein [Thermoanaerobaculia bacterium]
PVPAPPAAAEPAASAVAFADGTAGMSPKVLRAALDAVAGARSRGISGRKDLLTIIDYSLPSSEPRLWVLDLVHGKVLFHDLVAHGAGSGDNYATRFSNTMDSRQTSLGLFVTEGTYEGGNGYSLRLRGLDPGVNDQAAERNIVMHGAWYVSAEHVREHGRLGRSWGCPALSQETARPVIDAVKGGSFVFAYAKGAGAASPAPGTVVEAKAAALASSPEPVTAQP